MVEFSLSPECLDAQAPPCFPDNGSCVSCTRMQTSEVLLDFHLNCIILDFLTLTLQSGAIFALRSARRTSLG